MMSYNLLSPRVQQRIPNSICNYCKEKKWSGSLPLRFLPLLHYNHRSASTAINEGLWTFSCQSAFELHWHHFSWTTIARTFAKPEEEGRSKMWFDKKTNKHAGTPTVYCTTTVKRWVITHRLHVPHEKAEIEQIASSNKGKSVNVCKVEERRGRNMNGLLKAFPECWNGGLVAYSGSTDVHCAYSVPTHTIKTTCADLKLSLLWF